MAQTLCRRLSSAVLGRTVFLILFLALSLSAASAQPVNITIAGLYPMTGTAVVTGPQRAAMARLAAEFIREDPFFNQYLNFTIDFTDDQGDLTRAFVNALTAVQDLQYKVLLGPNRSSQSQLVSAVGAAFSAPLVSYASSSPSLSSKNEYPYFFRTCPSDIQQTLVWVSIMQHYEWRQCAVLASSDAYGTGVSSAFVNDATAAGISVTAISYFSPSDTDFTAALDTIKASNARIIVLAAIAGGGGRLIMKQAAIKGMMGQGSKYTWLIAEGSASSSLLLSSSTEAETTLSNAAFRAALLGNIATKPKGGSGELWDRLITRWTTNGTLDSTLYPGVPSPTIVTTDVYVPYSVDAVYAIAHAYRNMITNNMSLSDGTALRTALANVSFDGVTGRVNFDSNYDRNVPYTFLNLRDTTNVFEAIGEWNPSGLTVSTDAIWTDGTTKVPTDGLPRDLYWVEWNSAASIVVLIFVGIAELIIVATIGLVIKFEPTPVMRLASPVFLLITLTGLAILFSSLIPWMGQPNNVTCTIRLWLGFVGFVIAISAIIAKTYRVDVIFRRRRKIKKIVVTNLELVKYVALIIAPIVILLIVWTIVDHPKPSRAVDLTNNRFNVVCVSKSRAWLIASFVYCGLLMALSLVLSWRTRRVPDGFNETWYVYLSGYNTIVMGVIGVTLGYVLSKNLIAVLIIVTVTLIFGGLVIWGLLFLPKLYIALFKPERNTVALLQTKKSTEVSSYWSSHGIPDSRSNTNQSSSPSDRDTMPTSKSASPKEGRSRKKSSKSERSQRSERSTVDNKSVNVAPAGISLPPMQALPQTEGGLNGTPKRKKTSKTPKSPQSPVSVASDSVTPKTTAKSPKNPKNPKSPAPSKAPAPSGMGMVEDTHQPPSIPFRKPSLSSDTEESSSDGEPIQEINAQELRRVRRASQASHASSQHRKSNEESSE